MAQAILDIEIKGIQEAQSGMDALSASIVKVEQNQKQLIQSKKTLEKTIAENQKRQQELNNAYAKGEITQKNYEAGTEALTQSSVKATKQLVANTTALSNNKAELADLRKEQKQSSRLINAQADTLDELRRKLALAQTEYGKLDQSTEQGRLAAERFAQEINKLNQEVKEQEAAIGDHRRNVGNYGDALKGVTPMLGSFGSKIDLMTTGLSGMTEALEGATKNLGNIGGTATQAGGAVGGLKGVFSAVTTGIVNATRAGLAFIATPIGAAIAALAAIGTATKAFFDYNAEVQKTNALISGITNESGKVVDELRIQSGAMAEVLGVDQQQIVENAKVLVQQFGISYEEALAQMEQGILATNGANEEFMQSIGEYSTFFSQAGYSVEEFANIVNAGFDLGIYSDKLPDALKEADISLREMTSSTRDALVNAFGEDFTNEIATQVNSGAMTTKEALELMSQEAEKVGLSAEQAATLTADVFRGAGEDAGGALKIFEAVNVSLQDQTSELDEQGKRMQEEIARQEEVAAARDKAFNNKGIQAFSSVMKDLGAFLQKVFYGTIEAIGAVINFAFVRPFNMAKAVVTTIIDVFVNLGKGLGQLAMKFEPINVAVTKVKNGFTSMIDAFKRGFATFRATLDGLKAYGQSVLGSLGEALEAIGEGELIRAKNALADLGDDASAAYDRAYNKAMKDAMDTGVKTVEAGSEQMVKASGSAGSSAGQAFRDEFMEQYNEMKNDIARQPTLIQANAIFDNRDMDELETKLDYVTGKFASGEWTENTKVNLSELDGTLTGVTVTADEYFNLVQNRIGDIHREEEQASARSQRRREERRRAEEKALEEAIKRQAKIAELARTEEEQLRFRLDEQLKELELYGVDEATLTETQLAAKRALQQEYQDAIDKIEEDANNARITAQEDLLAANAEAFEKQLEMRRNLNEALAQEDLIAMNNEIAMVIGNEEEIAKIKEKYRKKAIEDEIKATTDMIETISQKIAEDQASQELGIDILSDEDVAEYEGRIQELKVLLSQLGVELAEINKGDDGEEKTIAELLGLDDEGARRLDDAIKGIEAGLGAMTQLVQARASERMASVDQMLERGVINEEEAEKKKEQIQKDAARKQQKIDIVQAVINTAKAVTAGLASTPFLPVGLIMGGIAAAQGAAQIKMIRSQRFAKGGILNGPSHAQGGIPMFSKGGAFYGEAEGGEAVLTKGVMANPALASMASAINVAGGGVPFFANGGVLDPIQTATPTDRAADIIASGIKSQQPVLVVEQLRERENSVDVMESLRTIG